jgi:hypothetical protein
VRGEWDAVLRLRDACLAATEETGRQLWGPARFAAYRVALDAPAELAAAMLEPGVVRFGLGPLTEVVAQHHGFAELAPHLDSSLLAVVAQERVLRGEDLRDDRDAVAALADSGIEVPLVLQPFEPAYTLSEYRADTRVDGGFLLPDEGWTWLTDAASGSLTEVRGDGPGRRAAAVARVLHDVVEPWLSGSDGLVELVTVHGGADDAAHALHRRLAQVHGDEGLERRPIAAAQLLGLVAFAAASGGVHGRRRGAAAGRASAWWLARTATGLDDEAGLDQRLIDELEFRLEDLELVALRSPRDAAWRLELAIADPAVGWAVAVAAFDLTDGDAAASDAGIGQEPHDVH